MEKEGLFYKRDSLSPKDIVELIRLWECGAGESFTDYCSFPRQTDKDFLEFLGITYPVLRENIHNTTLTQDISSLFQECEDYCTEWIPEGRINLWNEQYTLAYYPLAEFILQNDIAWQTFVEFFTDLDNTTDGTPWIDCYDIRKDFENGKF